MVVKDFHIGQMKTVVRFESNANKTALGKGFKDGYAELFTTRGRLSKYNGRRGLDSGELILSSQWELVCRFQTAIENDLTNSLRIVADNRFFTIDSYEKVDLQRRYYRFILNEDQQEL